jgi:hypothetical protein
MTEFLFAYGVLVDPRVQSKIMGRYTRGSPDLLVGFRFLNVDINGEQYSVLSPDPNSTITGVVLGLEPDELKMFDMYVGDKYRRRQLSLRSGKRAWVYLK